MKCAIYIRVSTDKEEQKSSLSNQRDLFFTYITNKGWSFYDLYVDVESGTSDKRPGLQRLIEDAANRKFDAILAKELSRLARNGGLSYKIRDLAERNGIHIITLDNAINTLEGNSSMFGLYAWVYEQESQRTSERIKSSLKTRAEKGLFKGSVPPYGYEVHEGKLHVKADDSPMIVQRIYKEYMQGKGFDAIARGLYNEGWPTPAQTAMKKNGNDKWHGSTIRTILTNPHYTGDLVQGRQTSRSVTSKFRENVSGDKHIVIKDVHEAIISKIDFDSVRALIETRKRQRPQAKIHLFTNTIFCADCKKGMHFKKGRRGYICGSYNKHGSKACSDHHVIETELESAILNDIENMFKEAKAGDFIVLAEEKIQKHFNQFKKDLKLAERQITTLKNQKTKLIQLLASEIITPEEYRTVVKKTEEELNNLLQSRLDLEQKLSNSKSREQLMKLKENLFKFSNVDVLTPELLHRLIDRIEIKADGTARIFYRFSVPTA